MMNLPYSYHTFLFPFVWKTDNEKTDNEKTDNEKKVEDLTKRLHTPHWQEERYNTEGVFPKNSGDAFKADYAMYQYFTEPARKLIFGQAIDDDKGEGGYMRLYSFHCDAKPWGRREAETQIGSYVITKGEKNYKLVIQSIKLNIYDAGVAIFSFELENWDQRNTDSVNAINEYGRRVSFPFLTPGSTYLTADKIEIKIRNDDRLIASQDFLFTSKWLAANIDHKPGYAHNEPDRASDSCLQCACPEPGRIHDRSRAHITPSFIMYTILDLLNYGNPAPDSGKITSYLHESDKNKSDHFIKPLIDDRMFVCCLVRDDKALKGLTSWNDVAGEYSYLSDCENKKHSLSDNLYKLIFIENSVSCVSRRMKKDLLSKSVYDRWIDYGTLYGVTHHSFVCITGEDREEKFGLHASVYTPFLTQYVEMAKIALVSRGTVLALSAEIADVAGKITSKDQKKLRDIEAMQQRYVKAQSQIMLFEVTAQEQGVELFDMLRDQFYLKEDKAELDGQMDNLRDVENIINGRLERDFDKKLNQILMLLSAGATLLAIFEAISFFVEPAYADEHKWLGGIVAVVITGVIICLFRRKLSSEKKHKKEEESP